MQFVLYDWFQCRLIWKRWNQRYLVKYYRGKSAKKLRNSLNVGIHDITIQNWTVFVISENTPIYWFHTRLEFSQVRCTLTNILSNFPIGNFIIFPNRFSFYDLTRTAIWIHNFFSFSDFLCVCVCNNCVTIRKKIFTDYRYRLVVD